MARQNSVYNTSIVQLLLFWFLSVLNKLELSVKSIQWESMEAVNKTFYTDGHLHIENTVLKCLSSQNFKIDFIHLLPLAEC